MFFLTASVLSISLDVLREIYRKGGTIRVGFFAAAWLNRRKSLDERSAAADVASWSRDTFLSFSAGENNAADRYRAVSAGREA